jgi:hypothetical protein
MCIEDPSKCTDQLKSLSERVQRLVNYEEDNWNEYFLFENEEE